MCKNPHQKISDRMKRGKLASTEQSAQKKKKKKFLPPPSRSLRLRQFLYHHPTASMCSQLKHINTAEQLPDTSVDKQGWMSPTRPTTTRQGAIFFFPQSRKRKGGRKVYEWKDSHPRCPFSWDGRVPAQRRVHHRQTPSSLRSPHPVSRPGGGWRSATGSFFWMYGFVTGIWHRLSLLMKKEYREVRLWSWYLAQILLLQSS